jgi:hypothetical protein
MVVTINPYYLKITSQPTQRFRQRVVSMWQFSLTCETLRLNQVLTCWQDPQIELTSGPTKLTSMQDPLS